MEKTDPPSRADELARLEEIERQAAAEVERRVDEAVERGEVVRIPLNVFCAAEDDLEEARVRARVDKAGRGLSRGVALPRAGAAARADAEVGYCRAAERSPMDRGHSADLGPERSESGGQGC
jgi:hypothetical protein